MSLLANGELHPVALGRRGLDYRAGCRDERRGREGGRGGRLGRQVGRHRGGRGRQGWRRRERGELAHGSRDVRSRGQLGHQDFDLLAAATPGLREDGLVIFRREVPPQQSHGGEGHLSRGEQIEDRREAAGGARGLNSVARRVFRQPQRLGAIAEEGYAEFGIMRSSSLDSASSRVGYSA